MRTFDLLLFSGKGIISNAIKLFTNQNISHAGAVLKFYNPVWLSIAEADPEVMAIDLERKIKEYNGSIYWHPLKHEFHKYRSALGKKMCNYTGIKYDYFDVLKQIFFKAAPNAKKMFCFEMIFLTGAFLEPKPLPVPERFKKVVPVGSEIINLKWWVEKGTKIA